jgi:conjugative relaxase-like TrwC/TraI family protein
MHGVGHANYYIELAQKDYYTAQGNDAGVWFGGGAEKLGLHGDVDSRAYEHLLRGRSPDGRRDLVQNAGDAQRQTAWDCWPKSPASPSASTRVAKTAKARQLQEYRQSLADVFRDCLLPL